METFDQDTREKIYKKYWHKCANSQEDGCLINQGLSIHHIVYNTKPNQKKYGDKLQSEENGLLLCQHCHNNQTRFKWIQDLENTLKNKWNEYNQK